MEKAEKDFVEHHGQLLEKIFAIMMERLAAHESTLRALPWDKKLEMDRFDVPSPYMATLVKESTVLHRILWSVLPQAEVVDIFQRVCAAYASHLHDAYSCLDSGRPWIRRRVAADATFLFQALSKLEVFAKADQGAIEPVQKLFNRFAMDINKAVPVEKETASGAANGAPEDPTTEQSVKTPAQDAPVNITDSSSTSEANTAAEDEAKGGAEENSVSAVRNDAELLKDSETMPSGAIAAEDDTVSTPPIVDSHTTNVSEGGSPSKVDGGSDSSTQAQMSPLEEQAKPLSEENGSDVIGTKSLTAVGDTQRASLDASSVSRNGTCQSVPVNEGIVEPLKGITEGGSSDGQKHTAQESAVIASAPTDIQERVESYAEAATPLTDVVGNGAEVSSATIAAKGQDGTETLEKAKVMRADTSGAEQQNVHDTVREEVTSNGDLGAGDAAEPPAAS